MTDKEKIRAEIERLISRRDEKTFLGIEKISALKEVLSFIDSMQEESVSEELESFANNIGVKEEIKIHIDDLETEIYVGMALKEAVKRAVKTGAQWMYEKMMKNAFEYKVKVDAGGYPYIPQMELWDYDKDEPLAKEGDRYKVILIKED